MFQISNESRKEKSIKKKLMENMDPIRIKEGNDIEGMKQESVRYYYVLIFFQWHAVYDYHVLYIVERCTWYF